MKNEKEKDRHSQPSAVASLSLSDGYWLAISRFERLYWQLTACTALVITLAVVAAVFWQVSIGLLTAVAAALMYSYFKKDAFRTHLGMRAKTVAGGLSITALDADGGETLFIPSRLVQWDVIALDDRALSSEKNDKLSVLYLPATLQKIGKDAFAGCSSLREIRFAGSEKTFRAIACQSDLCGISVVFDAKYPTDGPSEEDIAFTPLHESDREDCSSNQEERSER